MNIISKCIFSFAICAIAFFFAALQYTANSLLPIDSSQFFFSSCLCPFISFSNVHFIQFIEIHAHFRPIYLQPLFFFLAVLLLTIFVWLFFCSIYWDWRSFIRSVSTITLASAATNTFRVELQNGSPLIYAQANAHNHTQWMSMFLYHRFVVCCLFLCSRLNCWLRLYAQIQCFELNKLCVWMYEIAWEKKMELMFASKAKKNWRKRKSIVWLQNLTRKLYLHYEQQQFKYIINRKGVWVFACMYVSVFFSVIVSTCFSLSPF